MNILLMGPRGCGKTTLGDRLARARHTVFVDLDELVCSEFDDMTVEEIWADYGEDIWRRAETRVLTTILEDDDQVIALGGGTPMIEDVQRLLADVLHDICLVYLDTPAEVLAARLKADPGDRPSLTGDAIDDEVAGVLTARAPTYLALADVVCPCGDEPITETLERLSTVIDEAVQPADQPTDHQDAKAHENAPDRS